MKETIIWFFEGVPDSDTTVLAQDDTGEVGEAFHDGEYWRWASSTIIRKVNAWADMPGGPKA